MPGLFAVIDGQLVYATQYVARPEGTYYVAQAESYQYPLNGGWRYFEDVAAAQAYYKDEIREEQTNG